MVACLGCVGVWVGAVEGEDGKENKDCDLGYFKNHPVGDRTFDCFVFLVCDWDCGVGWGCCEKCQ